MADSDPSPPERPQNEALRNGLIVATHALGLFMAIVGGFIAVIAALLGLIQWIGDDSQDFSMPEVLVWFLIGIGLAVVGGFLARIKDPGAPVERPDYWASR